MKKSFKFGAALLLASLTSMAPANAADFPSRNVTLIVPYSAGGVTDTIARLVGQRLSKTWGQQVIVENKPGASGVIGIENLMKSAPDGYTLLFATNSEITVNPAVFKKLSYDPTKDLKAVVMMANMPIVWVVNKDVNINSISDLLVEAKKKPGKIAYSSVGNGSINHLAGEWFAHDAGVSLLHVPYTGGAPATTAVVSGEVPLGMVTLSSALPFIKSGEIKPIGTTTAERSKYVPNLPTFAESGLPGYDAMIWLGVFAPAGVSQEIVDKVRRDVEAAMKDPAIIENLSKSAFTPASLNGKAFEDRIKSDIEQFRTLAAKLNLKLN